jgi:hypothetical protein
MMIGFGMKMAQKLACSAPIDSGANGFEEEEEEEE